MAIRKVVCYQACSLKREITDINVLGCYNESESRIDAPLQPSGYTSYLLRISVSSSYQADVIEHDHAFPGGPIQDSRGRIIDSGSCVSSLLPMDQRITDEPISWTSIAFFAVFRALRFYTNFVSDWQALIAF